MARIRTIKPEFWKHEVLSDLPEPTHLLAGALLNYADDEGFFNANPSLVKAECSPLREPSVPIQTSLQLLTEVGYVRLGRGVDGRKYGQVVTFQDHQVVNRPTPSKIKALPIVWEGSDTYHEQLTEDSLAEGKGREGNREWKGTPSSKPNGSDPPPLVLDNPKTDGKVERLRQVTIDAIETFNAAKFTKAQGGTVPNVSTVGLDTRMKQVARVVKTAREICQANGGGKIDAEFWADYWAAVNDDPFKSGRQKPGNGHENWTPSFEYLTRPKAMLEVFEKGGA